MAVSQTRHGRTRVRRYTYAPTGISKGNRVSGVCHAIEINDVLSWACSRDRRKIKREGKENENAKIYSGDRQI